jgi:hypothetical protein
MRFPKTFEYIQWEMCQYCGQKKVPHPKYPVHPERPWLVCPKDVVAMSKPTLAETFREPRCEPPAVLVEPFIHGAYYRGHCRNASIARYNAETNRFVYWRQKFGDVFAEDIHHAGNDDGFDIFQPFAKIDLPEGFKEIPMEA